MLFKCFEQKIHFILMVIRYNIVLKVAKREQKQLKRKADKFKNKSDWLNKYIDNMKSYYRNSYFYSKHNIDDWFIQ